MSAWDRVHIPIMVSLASLEGKEGKPKCYAVHVNVSAALPQTVRRLPGGLLPFTWSTYSQPLVAVAVDSLLWHIYCVSSMLPMASRMLCRGNEFSEAINSIYFCLPPPWPMAACLGVSGVKVFQIHVCFLPLSGLP